MADDLASRRWAGVWAALGGVFALGAAGLLIVGDQAGRQAVLVATGIGVAAIMVAALVCVLVVASGNVLDAGILLVGAGSVLWYAVPSAETAWQGIGRLAVALLAAAVALRYAERAALAGVLACCATLATAASREADRWLWSGLAVATICVCGLVMLRHLLVQRESRELAAIDSLTGLANRQALHEALTRALVNGEGDGHSTGVLLVDLNGFKQVNDVHGHAIGDRLLAGFGALMHDSILGGDVVGRVGGDEFAVILHDIGGTGNADAVARRISTATEQPIVIGGQAVRITASIGIAVGGPGECTPDELLHRAGLAIQQAKRRTGGTRWVRWDPSLTTEAELSLEQELRTAVGRDELRLVYQPIVALPAGDLTGVEALVRWQHPRHGLLLPDVFVPLAERAGVIDELGRWVLDQASRQVRGWQQRAPGLQLSVNVSPRQLEHDEFAADVLKILERTGFFAGNLVLEVAESAVFREADAVAVAQLDALSQGGIRIALDDFGTGFSSLRYLTQLPVDVLKLDSGFVAELDGTSKGSAVAQAVLRLGQMLHLDTIAEGVEDEAQARELTLLGCAKAQGRYFSMPLPAEQLERQLPSETSA